MTKWRATQGQPGALRTSPLSLALVFPASTRYHDITNPLTRTAASPRHNQIITQPPATEQERPKPLCEYDTLPPENRLRNPPIDQLQLALHTLVLEDDTSHTLDSLRTAWRLDEYQDSRVTDTT
jgi:hypothetical protein